MMLFQPDIHHRHSIRLQDFDYASANFYFVTICAKERLALFANSSNSKKSKAYELNEYGRTVEQAWLELPRHNPTVTLDAYIVMPDHFHGIIALTEPRAGLEPAPTITLAEVIRQFKTFSARRINEIRNAKGQPVWQRGYFERIVRDDRELRAIREYVRANPQTWKVDQLENMPF